MKKFLTTIALILIAFFCFFHLYYALVSIARASNLPQTCNWFGSKVTTFDDSWCLESPNMVVSGGEKTYNDSRFNPTLIEKEKALKQNLKLENEELKKKLEESKLLIENWQNKETRCNELQLKYNQIYLIVNQ